MDPLTQGVVGAVAAGCLANADKVRSAIAAGWLGGMLADLDVLIRSGDDPLLQIEYHRHFSHSLLFIPVGGLVACLVLWPFLGKRLGGKSLYLFATCGYATAGLLDACTSYGTRLLWPFSDERIAWNIISIIDPIFTLILLLLVGFSFRYRWRLPCGGGLVFAVAYLIFGVNQRDFALGQLKQLVEDRGHEDAGRFTVKPSLGNLLVWRGIYEWDEQLFVDAVRVPYLSSDYRFYEGRSKPLVDAGDLLAKVPEGSAVWRDVERFDHFSDGYLVWHPDKPNVLADARYAILPNSMQPLWGVEVDVGKPEEHGAFINFRSRAKEQGFVLWKMILGEDL